MADRLAPRRYVVTGRFRKLRARLYALREGKSLHRVDLAAVVSKYIGETEKNLEAVFARAEEKDWILFFDEADALFGERTEVRDAHDTYANQEVSYVLQRIEDAPGAVIVGAAGAVPDGLRHRLRRR